MTPDEAIVYTEEELGIKLQKLAPYIRLSPVPKEGCLEQAWGVGIGLRTPLSRAVLYDLNTFTPILAIATDSPAKTAGLVVGDRVQSNAKMLGSPAGTSVAFNVQRQGHLESVTLKCEALSGTHQRFEPFSILEDRDGLIWFGLFTGEVVCFDIQKAETEGISSSWRLYQKAQVNPSDCIVFCSDGIIESENPSGEQLGYERTEKIIRQACETEASSKAIIDQILNATNDFQSTATQNDAMTCVVVRMVSAS